MASVKVPQQKVILCGEYGVGKSSLFRRYAFNTFVSSTKRQSTLGLDHFNKEYNVKGKSMRVSYSLIKIQNVYRPNSTWVIHNDNKFV